MMRRDIMHMATEVLMARTEPVDSICHEDMHPVDVVGMLEGGDCDDPIGRAAITILCFPNVTTVEEMTRLGIPELIEAAQMAAECER